jgi:hypothetical protein
MVRTFERLRHSQLPRRSPCLTRLLDWQPSCLYVSTSQLRRTLRLQIKYPSMFSSFIHSLYLDISLTAVRLLGFMTVHSCCSCNSSRAVDTEAFEHPGCGDKMDAADIMIPTLNVSCVDDGSVIPSNVFSSDSNTVYNQFCPGNFNNYNTLRWMSDVLGDVNEDLNTE